MRMYPKKFPSTRRGKPKRRAERRVYEALANSNRQGFVFYEWRRGYEKIELDFAVWVEGLGRFALQVKGGRYVLIDGEWYLKTRGGLRLIESCPLDETWLAMLDLHDDIAERAQIGYNPYALPVLVFPDMEPDPAIGRLAERKGRLHRLGRSEPPGRPGEDRPEPAGVGGFGDGPHRPRGARGDRRVDLPGKVGEALCC